MLKATMMALFALTISTGAIAQSAETAPPAAKLDTFKLAAKGDGPWSIWCDYEARGGESTRNITPDKDHAGSLIVTHMSGGSCHYSGGYGPLTMTITSDAWSCPFKSATDAACELVVPRLGSGEFRLKRSASSR